MTHAKDKPMPSPTTERRDFLYYATASTGAVAVGAAVWPLINSMNPSADVAAAGTVRVDLSDVEPGQRITVKWRGAPGLRLAPICRGNRGGTCRQPRRSCRSCRQCARELERKWRQTRARRKPFGGRGWRMADRDRCLYPSRLYSAGPGRVCGGRVRRLVLPLSRIPLRHFGPDPERSGTTQPRHPTL